MRLRFFFPLLLLFLNACAPPVSTGSPSSTPADVVVRVENQSGVDFEALKLSFPSRDDTEIAIPALSAGTVSDPFTITAAYQSAAVTLTAGGRPYAVEALDIAAETPITSGEYRFVLTLPNDNLVVDFRPDTAARKASVESLIEALEAAGATVLYEPSIPRETLFDRLFGRTVARPELLQVDNQRVWLYQFDDEETARAAAGAITPGGTSLLYTRPEGTVAREFVGGVGQQVAWWQWGPFLVQLGEFVPPDPSTTARISTALNSPPLHARLLDSAGVQLRLANLSAVDFERVVVDVNGRKTDYGPLPRGRVSLYLPQNGAYRYAGVTVVADEIYQFVPIDFMGETPLAPGAYTYALDVANGMVSILHVDDDTPAADPALQGRWFWSSAQRADGSFFTPEGVEGEQPFIEFTDTPDPNQPGFTYTGFGGCNALFGAYLLSPPDRGSGFVTAGTGGTAQGCADPVMQTETYLQDALSGIVNYSIDAATLTLHLSQGDSLTFTRP